MSQPPQLANQLLNPPQEQFADATGAPFGSNGKHANAPRAYISWAASNFTSLIQHTAQTPTEALMYALQPTPQRAQSSLLIEEISKEQEQLHEEQELQAQLLLKCCQVAALYAADPALLTPWSSHQLDVAARALLKQLCSTSSEIASSVQPAVLPSSEQHFLVAVLPSILPLISSDTAHTSASTNHISSPPEPGAGPASRSV